MKLTVDNWAKMGCPDIKVLLNGKTIDQVTMADEDNGELERYRSDLIEPGMEEIPREILRGKVEILMGGRK